MLQQGVRSACHATVCREMETLCHYRDCFGRKVVVAQIACRVLAEIVEVPILGKSLRREIEDCPWIALQGTQRGFLSNLIGARGIRFRLSPSTDEVVKGIPLAVSRRQIFN